VTDDSLTTIVDRTACILRASVWSAKK